uniref:Retrotransposon gag domain-containing protein n=1 Tax=Phytophthora ramorum TaxID=164328 RepID=H3GD67_PHYRM
MVKGSTSPSDTSPATVGGSPLAESSSTRASVAAMEADVTRTVQFDEFDDDDQGREEEEEEKDDDDEKTGLAAELSEDADDEQGLAPGDRPPLVPKATRNAETPKANRVLARLVEEMRTGSRWMNMFAPMYMCQAKSPELSEDQTIEQLVEDTVLLLRAMGYRCGHKPSKPALTTCNGGLKGQVPQSRRADELLDEQKAPPLATAQPYVAEPYVFPELSEDPSKVPLPKTPETKRGVFRRSEGTPYFVNSHMPSPNKVREQRGRRPMAEFLKDEEAAEFRRLVRADAVMASGRDDELSEDDNYADRREFDESPYDRIRQLSFDEAERTERYRSDDALQWIKRFYEMKWTCKRQDEWCEPFSLSLGKAPKGWYRQLPKKTQRKWSLLSEAFLDYYCSQFDQSARSRYYSARRRENEHLCDFLLRLNGYARTAQIQYERGGADAADHVEHFLLSCGDDDVMDLLYPQRLSDIHKVEKIINQRLLGGKRKKQRDRLSTARSREPRRGDPKTQVVGASLAEITDATIVEKTGVIDVMSAEAVEKTIAIAVSRWQTLL